MLPLIKTNIKLAPKYGINADIFFKFMDLSVGYLHRTTLL